MNDIGEKPNFWSTDHAAPSEITDKEASFKDFGSSMNAISLGFVATAILISMFLIMAIFEHLLRPRNHVTSSRSDAQVAIQLGESQAPMQSIGKLRNSYPVETTYAMDFSVLMPGQLYPTFIAQPVPHPVQREGVYWPSHDHHSFAMP